MLESHGEMANMVLSGVARRSATSGVATGVRRAWARTYGVKVPCMWTMLMVNIIDINTSRRQGHRREALSEGSPCAKL
jgi:hypothetical protein